MNAHTTIHRADLQQSYAVYAQAVAAVAKLNIQEARLSARGINADLLGDVASEFTKIAEAEHDTLTANIQALTGLTLAQLREVVG